MSAPASPGSLPDPTRLFEALAEVGAAETLDGAAEAACQALVAASPWKRAAFVQSLPSGLVFGCAGLEPADRDALRGSLLRFGPVERSANRLFVLETHRLAPDLDVAFIAQERRERLPAVLLRSPAGAGPAGAVPPGERWEEGDELVLLPHQAGGASLGTLALAAPADGRRPTAADAPALRALLAFARAVGALVRSRERALEGGREQARRVLDHVRLLARADDVDTLLDRLAEVSARIAGYGVGVLTAHMDDGSHVGTWNLPAAEREAFRRSSRGTTVESTARKRARIRSLAFPGTGIAYVPHDAPLERSSAFAPGRAVPGGSWHPEDRLFVLLKTTQGRDIGVLSLDEPADGRAPAAGSLGALLVAERFLDLGGALLETRLLQAQVERTQRLEAVGTLVTGIAHDFNNLLGAIMGYASLLRIQLPEGSGLAPTVRTLEDACERAAGLTRRLRALTQTSPAEKRPVDLAAVVADTARVVRETFDRRIAIETEVTPQLPPVLGDEGALSRALLNLCINARDAQPEGGRILLRASAVLPPEGGPAEAVQVDVQDAGPGLSPQARQHLFEPFFTTKARGKGTGLGLFAAWSTARGHGGSLEALEPKEGGALFRLRLPAAGALPRRGAGAERAPGPSGRCILVVEDESALQDLIVRGLEMLGHRVECAWDGQEAIDLLERRAPELDLVLLDLLLPRRSGAEVFRAAKSLRPDLPVILSSGNVEEALLDADLKAGVAATLPKPWTLPQLHEVVQQVLASRGRGP